MYVTYFFHEPELYLESFLIKLSYSNKPLLTIYICRYKISIDFHYADETQLYVPLKPGCPVPVILTLLLTLPLTTPDISFSLGVSNRDVLSKAPHDSF